MEIFAPAFGLEAHYEVSNLGNLRRTAPGQGARVGRNFGPPSKGYHTARICIDGRPRTIAVHRLVVETFLRPMLAGEQVNHIDGNKLNNRLSNLEIVTAGGNTRHAVRVLGWKPKRHAGESNGNSMLTAEQAAYVKTHHFAYGEIARLAAEWGVKKSTLYAVRAGINWKHA